LLRRLRGATPFPGFRARMRPSDSPVASARAVVSLAVGVPRVERFSGPAVRAFVNARRAGGLGTGSSAAPATLVDRQGSPRLLSHLRPTRHRHTPRRVRQRLALSRCCRLLPSELLTSWASRYISVFGADVLVAHGLACLRIHRCVAAAVARLATDLSGSALVGRDSHPPDDKQDFVKLPHSSLLPDQQCLVAPGIQGLNTVRHPDSPVSPTFTRHPPRPASYYTFDTFDP
jgi:hypothetical protein